MNILHLVLIAMFPVIAGCASTVPAPVEDRGAVPAEKPVVAAAAADDSRAGFYTVKKGDTLYSIALDNGQDYKDVAAWNNLDNPNVIQVGQQLRVAPADSGAPV
ncbi:MAG: LysM domain-containing protein, partial [Sulfuritalea sp.]|nr:LysM domain-containing protein [Sulfuritalea sp.]